MAKPTIKKGEGIYNNLPKYDSNKNYEWKPEDKFELSGEEFSLVFNTLLEEVRNNFGTSMLNKVTAFNVLQSILVKGVESGIITEQK